MNYLVICYVRKGKFVKLYKHIEFEILAESEDEAKDEAGKMMRGLFPGGIWFVVTAVAQED